MNTSCSRYFKYAYDGVGNRTRLETRKAETLYRYDAADELQSASEAKHAHHQDVTHYAYDPNGNQTRAGSTVYAYNLENKLTQVTDKGEKISYTYTADGLMASRSTRSEATSYAWDTSSDLGQLALETDSRGAGRFASKDTRAYTYGAGPLGIVTQKESYTFHTDSLGSVVELSDAKGKLVESYRYSPYGEDYAPGSSGEAQDEELNPIRFTGQYLDSEADLYDVRAREYEPETGSFLQVDPLETDAGDPAVGAYVYVGDQPTVMTDPSGACAMMMSVVGSMGGSTGGAGSGDQKDLCHSLLAKVFRFAYREKYTHGGKFSGTSGIEERYMAFLNYGRKTHFNWETHIVEFKKTQQSLRKAIKDFIDRNCPPPGTRVAFKLWTRAGRLSTTPAPTKARVAIYQYEYPDLSYDIWWVDAADAFGHFVKQGVVNVYNSGKDFPYWALPL